MDGAGSNGANHVIRELEFSVLPSDLWGWKMSQSPVLKI